MNTPMHITKFVEGHTFRLEHNAGAYEVVLDGERIAHAEKLGDRWVTFWQGTRFQGSLEGMLRHVLYLVRAAKEEVR